MKVLNTAGVMFAILFLAEAVYATDIRFGYNEVRGGGLTTVSGAQPVAGERANLIIDLFSLQSFVCSGQSYCAGLQPSVYVRFRGSEDFQSVGKLPTGYVAGRGPEVRFETGDVTTVSLDIPKDAERVEVYATFNRYSYGTQNCSWGYDRLECEITGTYFQNLAYVSNFGRNFSIAVLSR